MDAWSPPHIAPSASHPLSLLSRVHRPRIACATYAYRTSQDDVGELHVWHLDELLHSAFMPALLQLEAALHEAL
jgi:hypothetical protein